MARVYRMRHPAYADAEVIEELAAAIDTFLRKLERNPETNPRQAPGELSRLKYDYAHARPLEYAPLIEVRYSTFRQFRLTEEQASEYLGRLKRGFTGRHDE